VPLKCSLGSDLIIELISIHSPDLTNFSPFYRYFSLSNIDIHTNIIMSGVTDYPVEIIPGRLYFVCTQQQTSRAPPGVPANAMCYWLDKDLIYEPFCADFGPCNLGHAWRFCQRVNHLLQQCGPRGQPVYLLVGLHPHKRANAAALVGIHSVLYLGKRAEEAYAPLRQLEPFAGFRDASCGVPTFTLGVSDIIRGMYRAKEVGFINWHAGEKFNLEEYEHYEQVENGDLNWIVPGKLMAFSGPSAQPKHFGGWRTFTPEDYIEYFREKGVTSVIRLNKKMYEGARFTAHGVNHHELYFPDGTCPSEPIMYRFLDIVEKEPGAIAIHCKAGLGRTGVLICCYMIKNYGFTAEEAMAYIRVCRPGSVIGPQQHYLMQYAPRLLHEGRTARRAASFPADPMADMGLRLDDLTQAAGGNVGSRTAAAAAAASPNRGAGGTGERKVINLVATSRTADILAAQQGQGKPPLSGVRRSPRLANTSTSSAKNLASAAGSSNARPSESLLALTEAAAAAGRMEPSHIVSVPGNKPTAHSRSSGAAPVHVHTEGETNNNINMVHGSATPPRQPTFAPMPSLGNSPATAQDSGEISGASTPLSMKPSLIPPSSTKRVLAPNGQPRKIPMAVDFDSVAPSALEDRDMTEEELSTESWTVSSQPVPDRNYNSTSRVGAFAAAAGRGASAFVEAFRSAVGAHKASYNGGNRRS
jgi:cell division cycle 14